MHLPKISEETDLLDAPVSHLEVVREDESFREIAGLLDKLGRKRGKNCILQKEKPASRV